MINDEYLEAVRRLHFWQYGNNPTNFTSMLYSMFQKADVRNIARLARAFPVEAAVYLEWYEAPSENEFFKRYNLKPFSKLYDQEPPEK